MYPPNAARPPHIKTSPPASRTFRKQPGAAESERLFAALSGTGGTARLVMLPLESHGYSARESVAHTVHEMLSWFDKHVKSARPRTTQAAAER